jgi:hypothetical protein
MLCSPGAYALMETLSVKKMDVFWDVALYSLVETDRRFRGAYCIHYQGRLHGTTPQKAVIFVLAAVRT